jgi:regulator of sigma E protease
VWVISEKSPVLDKLKPGDVIKSIEVRNANAAANQPGDAARDVSWPGFVATVNDAGLHDRVLDFVVVRGGKDVAVRDVKATVDLKDREGNARKGVGVAPAYEEQTPVIAAVAKDSPAANVKDGLPAGALITAIDGTPVRTWFDVRKALAKAGGHKLTLLPAGGDKPIERTITLDDKQAQAVANVQLTLDPMMLAEEIVVRQTGNPLTAIGWGALETRDLILQFYVTLQRMFGGSISASNLMGPVGIFGAGAQFAFRGTDWLLWFLAMISANLAVVNFLPIPIVDGGLFLFLIMEKIMGRPLSKRAQEIAQFAGLALILSVFVMVTYNDIARFFN